MSQILNKIRDVDPNNSDAIKEALAPFFQNLAKHTEADCGRWLHVLEDVINRFPKYCMSQRSMIETHLTHFLDSQNYYVVIEAAKCAHALQQVRPTQEKTATAKSCWRDLLNALCDAAHMVIGALFPHAVDIYEQAGKLQKEHNFTSSPFLLALSQLSTTTAKIQYNNVLNKQALYSTRLRNIFVFLQAMLVEVYPVAKPIRPKTILDVIVRALSVSSGTNFTNQSLDDVLIVKTQALRSLDALVACLGSNLIPFSPLVIRFVMQTLKWSSDNPSEQSRKVRISAYSTLSGWLNVLHTHRMSCDRSSCEDELTQHIIQDITPKTHVVELKMSNQSTKNLSKKAKRRLANTMLQDSTIAAHMPGEKNKTALSGETCDEVAIAALECAQVFLTVCGIFLKPTTHKRFQERLVRECCNTTAYSPQRGLSVLRALECARKCTPPTVPPPTQYCLHLYSVLLNTERREISSFCSQALLDIRLHLHCSPPSLNFATEIHTETQKRTEEKKIVSEKNRAALEALLGPDRFPNRDKDEEIITITEEPSRKKLRLDETDKISLSSESVKSLEANDDNNDDDDDVEFIAENVDEGSKFSDEINAITAVKETKEQNSIDDELDGIDTQPISLDDNNAIDDDNIDTDATQIVNKQISEDKIDSTQPDNGTIFEAVTQMPLNISNDDEDETPVSMEVAYDYPNTGTEKLTVLEKLDAENIPSSNDTDDIQITCGQVVKSSQEVELPKLEIEVKSAEIKENGVEKTPDKLLQNGDVTASNDNVVIASIEVTVEDMLADFVDEVNEDTQASTKD